MIALERKRTERSAKPFLLMLLETGEHQAEEKNGIVLAKVITALSTATRETDVIGWHKNHSCIGVMFTQLVIVDQKSLLSAMLNRVGAILRDSLSFEQFSQIIFRSISFQTNGTRTYGSALVTRRCIRICREQTSLASYSRLPKRVMDVSGSLLLLTICSPLLLMVAIAVSSLLYRFHFVPPAESWTIRKAVYIPEVQVHVHRQTDATVHKDYVMQLIAGRAERHPTNGNGNSDGVGVYKLTNDKRITRVGGFLRRTTWMNFPSC